VAPPADLTVPEILKKAGLVSNPARRRPLRPAASRSAAGHQPTRTGHRLPMAAASADHQHGRIDKEKELLSSVVGDIRCYSGSDPLRPWLRYGPAPNRRAYPERRPPLLSSSLIELRSVFLQGDPEAGGRAAAGDAAGEATEVPPEVRPGVPGRAPLPRRPAVPPRVDPDGEPPAATSFQSVVLFAQ
jgi:hypothetical protein